MRMDVDIFDVTDARFSPFQLFGVTHLTLTFCGVLVGFGI